MGGQNEENGSKLKTFSYFKNRSVITNFNTISRQNVDLGLMGLALLPLHVVSHTKSK